jgi:hypothetical protein
VKEKRLGLDYLVTTLVSFDVTDPRDTIYALLAIARDNLQEELKPSQKKSPGWATIPIFRVDSKVDA